MDTSPIKPSQDIFQNLEKELEFWAARVANKIKRNFYTLDINTRPGGKGKAFTGDLLRNIYWKVHSAAGGNAAAIEFFYLRYGKYVELAVGNGLKSIPLPAMTKVEQIARPDGASRKAKPFLSSEIRHHARWLQKRLFEEYMYAGSIYITSGFYEGLQDPSETQKWIATHQKELRDSQLFYLD